jgi:signal transduction histidine kinase
MTAPTPLGLGVVVASFAASAGAAYLLLYLYRQRGKSGANWFMGNIASVAVFCLSYGVSLLVFDPTFRIGFAVVAFVCVCFMGPFFLAFGLDYTGRGNLIRTPLFGVVAAVPLLSVVLAATNPVHELVWTDFQFDPVLGLATATYTIQPWGIFAFLFSIGTAAVGSLLLIGAVLSYGPLYRREATAVTLSTVPPSLGVSLWMLGVGPVPQLHLTAPLMLVHVALDGYAFVGTHMFETNPATQRMAEQTGLDSLSDPVLVLDRNERVVRMNGRAEALFVDASAAELPASLEAVTGTTLETLRETGELAVDADDGGTFAVSFTELTDPTGEPVGSMVVLYDVTEERRRRQQLGVLNRVLRHNLRNETTVISGYAELLEATVDDPEQASQLGVIAAASDRLKSIAEKARSFEEVQERVADPEPVSVEDVVTDVVGTYSAAHDEAAIEWAVEPSGLSLHADRRILSLLLGNIVENAIVHSESPEPSVEVSASESTRTDRGVRFEIRDENDRIPEHEIETLRAGEETSLQHGQGIGLWIAYWCTRKLRGDIGFEYDDGNVLTVTL